MAELHCNGTLQVLLSLSSRSQVRHRCPKSGCMHEPPPGITGWLGSRRVFPFGWTAARSHVQLDCTELRFLPPPIATVDLLDPSLAAKSKRLAELLEAARPAISSRGALCGDCQAGERYGNSFRYRDATNFFGPQLSHRRRSWST